MASLCFFGCKSDDKDVPIKSISLLPSSLDAMYMGQTVQVEATVLPDEATEEVYWFSGNEDIVTVQAVAGSKGRKAIITSHSAGTIDVYATNPAQTIKSQELTVTVSPQGWSEITAIVLKNTQMPFGRGEMIVDQTSFNGSRNYAVQDWLSNADGSANGNVFEKDGVDVFNNALGMMAWAAAGWPLPVMTNGKLYQTVDL